MSDFEDFVVTPTPAGSERFVSPETQAQRDLVRRRYLQSEVDDPNLPGGEATRAATAKHLERAGGRVAPTIDFDSFKPAAPQQDFGFKTGEKELGFVEDLVSNAASMIRALPGEALAGADLVASIPAQLIGVGAGMGMRARAIGAGKSRAEQAQADLDARAIVMEKLGNPFRKLLGAAGAEVEQNAGVDQVMAKVSSWLERGGKWVEDKTGGAVKAGDVQTLADTAMAAGGGRGIAAGLERLVTPPKPGMGPYKPAVGGRGVAPRVEPTVGDIPPMEPATPATPAGKTRLTTPTVLEATPEGGLREAAGAAGTELPKPTTLDTALEKVTSGRGFDMTPEELVALRGWKQQPAPQILNAEGAPLATSAPLRLPRGQRGAIDVDALFQRRNDGSGLSLDEFEKLSPTLALGSLLARSDYTLKTLDRLPQNRTEFSKAHIEQELKRQDVTDAERGVLRAALSTTDGPTITAKDLIVGVKKATGDFELTPKKTDQYASYGLDSIDRMTEMDRDPDAIADARMEGLDIKELTAGEVQPTTTLYRLPERMQMSDANHFNDPQLFGWTRSFEENGVRHVVEIQSDLAQHTKGAVGPERVGELTAEYERLGKLWRQYYEWSHDPNPQILERLRGMPEFQENFRRGENNPQYILRQARQRIETRRAEIETALHSTAIDSQLAPITKNWPKRLVREELAQAEQAGEKVVRFATADTVAKVEGWPRERQVLENSIAHLERMQRSEEAAGLNSRTTIRNLAEERANLANLGERQFSPEHQGIYDRYRRDIEKFLGQLGGKPYTDSAGHTWIEVPVKRAVPKQMFGGADTDLLKPLAGAAVGAALGLYLDREPGDSGLGGAVLGSLAGGFAMSGAAKSIRADIAAGLDRGLGMLSTRIGNISPALLHRSLEFERRVLSDTHARIAATDAFLVQLEKLKSPELDRAIKTNDTAAIDALMPESLKPAWQDVRKTLDSVGAELKARGRVSNLIEGYFPRVVKDVPGLLEKLGGEDKTLLEQRLLKAEQESIRAGQGGLDAAAKSEVINKFLQERRAGSRPGFAQRRTVAEVTAELDPFYASNTEALHTYLASATQSIERARFFGRDLVTKEVDGRQVVDLNSSIGRVVQRELEAGKISPRQADELAEMLRARFEYRATSGVVQDLKNLANLGLLGNIISAGTQLGDLGTAFYAQGLRPSLESLARTLARNNKVSMKDFGLVDHLSEEFVSTRKTAEFLNGAFKLSGFSGIDALGKNVMLNAALSKYQKLAQTAKGRTQIEARYKGQFGDDMPALLEELQTRNIGEQTRALLFSELSRFQPISKLEVPQKYLEMPNGRVIYMLKTFTLKQADIVRRDAYQEIKNGNVAKGIGNLTRYAVTLGIAGAATQSIKDWMMGREFDFGDAVGENMLKTFGLSSYVMDKVRQGKTLEATAGLVAPPYKMFDDIVRDDSSAARYIPLFGPLIYAHLYNGKEKALAAQAKQNRKAGKPLTAAETRALEVLRQERARKRQERKQ